MYKCVYDMVETAKQIRKMQSMENELQSSVIAECPVEGCGTVFKGEFAKIIILGVEHYNRYHNEEI